MKDFKYTNEYGLRAANCMWLKIMGLKETRWILDTEWFLTQRETEMTFKEWVK